MHHNDMWKHIDKEIIEKKYGGTANDLDSFWPPNAQKLLYESPVPRNKLIST